MKVILQQFTNRVGKQTIQRDVWVSKYLLPLKIQRLTYTPVVSLCEDVSLPVSRNLTALRSGNEDLLGGFKHNFYFGQIMSSLMLLSN